MTCGQFIECADRAQELADLKFYTRQMLRALDGYEAAEKRKQQSRPGDPESYVDAGEWVLIWGEAFEVARVHVERLIGKP